MGISYEPLWQTMKEKGISSYRLEKMGFNRATYHALRKGRSVSTNTIAHLCRLLDCRVQDVMEYMTEEPVIERTVADIFNEMQREKFGG